jgi:hypothetical protein
MLSPLEIKALRGNVWVDLPVLRVVEELFSEGKCRVAGVREAREVRA